MDQPVRRFCAAITRHARSNQLPHRQLAAGSLPLVFLAMLSACAPAQLGQRDDSRVLAIEHVNAIPMDTDRVLADHTIIVRDGVIQEVGPAATARIPGGAQRIDGRGLYAIPGMSDMHAHLDDTEGFPSYLAYGVTTLMNMHGSPPTLRWKRDLAEGKLEGPTIYAGSPTVNGFPPANPVFISIQDTAQARATARDQKRLGYDVIKAYSFLNRDVYEALLDESKRVGIPVAGHIPWALGYAPTVRAGQANIAHIEEFFQQGDIPDDSIPNLVRVVKESGATVTANLFAYADYISTIRSIQAVMDDPEIRYASPAQYSEKIPTNNRALQRSDLAGFSKFLTERLPRFRKLAKAFVDAGVPILVGTDTETFGFPGQAAHLELALLVEAGFTPYQALQASTRDAGEFVARYIDARDRFGTLAPGMRADIALVRGNPLADIRSAQSIAGVVVRGRWYPPARLRQMRDSLAARNTPKRRFVYEFDSLMNKAKNAAQAAASLRRFRTEYPSAIPLAELVWIGYGRMLYQQDKPSSMEIRKMAAEVFPESFSAQNQLGRGYLFAFDTTAALNSFRASLALQPHNLVVTDMIAKLEAARRGPALDPTGVYTFDPVVMQVQGKPQTTALLMTVSRDSSGYRARLKINADTASASEVSPGGDRLWVTAQYARAGWDLELRLSLTPGEADGTWILGWANNGPIRATRTRGAAPR